MDLLFSVAYHDVQRCCGGLEYFVQCLYSNQSTINGLPDWSMDYQNWVQLLNSVEFWIQLPFRIVLCVASFRITRRLTNVLCWPVDSGHQVPDAASYGRTTTEAAIKYVAAKRKLRTWLRPEGDQWWKTIQNWSIGTPRAKVLRMFLVRSSTVEGRLPRSFIESSRCCLLPKETLVYSQCTTGTRRLGPATFGYRQLGPATPQSWYKWVRDA